MNRLSLMSSEVTRTSQIGSKQVRTTVPFLDFVVDGTSLRAMAQTAGYGSDFVTSLCRAWVPTHVAKAVDLLVGAKSDGGAGVDMLVCTVCGDRDCGAVLGDVTVTDDVVTWSNWRWTNYEQPGEPI